MCMQTEADGEHTLKQIRLRKLRFTSPSLPLNAKVYKCISFSSKPVQHGSNRLYSSV